MEATIIQTVAQLGAMGLLVYLVVLGVPKWLAGFREDQKEQRAEQKEERDAHNRSLESLVNAFRDEQRFEREHCQEQFKEVTTLISRNQEMNASSLKAIERAIESHQAFAEQSIQLLRQK